MLITKTVIISWTPANKDHLILRGYNFTKMKDKIEVKIEDLMKGSHAEVQVLCDYCLEKGIETIITPEYRNYIKKGIIDKDCCVKCRSLKVKESNMKIYGVESLNALPETQVKRRKTCLDRYGVDHPNKDEEMYSKSQETNLKRYGYKNALQNQEIKNKQNNTIKNKYGVDNISQLEEVKEKKRKTTLKNFGVEYPTQNKEVVNKVMVNKAKTLFENGTAPASYAQIYINNVLNGELNYPINGCNLDVLLQNKIYVECDLGGHNLNVIYGQKTQEEFDKKEIRRNYYLKNKGYKMIRIIAYKNNIPLDDKILEIINYAIKYLDTGHSWIRFDIDNEKIITSQFNIDFDYGKLRRITKKTLEKQLLTQSISNY